MDALYYVSGILLALGIPALGFSVVAALVKPHLVNDRSVIKTPMSREKIAKVGVVTIIVSIASLSMLLAATEPASVKAERAERQAAEASVIKQQQEAEAKEKAANEARLRKEEAKKPVVKTEAKTEVVPFESVVRDDNTIASGQTRVLTAGVNGERIITYEVMYIQGKETARTEVKNEITTAPVTQVTLNGTYVAPAPQPAPRSSCDPNYSGCVPNVSYDLDCPDIGFTVQVLGYDKHRLDRDGDGYGCESY